MMSEAAAQNPAIARPLVAAPVSNRGIIAFGIVLALGATALFAALETRRSEITSPATAAVQSPDSAVIAPPPELSIPPAFAAPASPFAPAGRPGAIADPLPAPALQGKVPGPARSAPRQDLPTFPGAQDQGQTPPRLYEAGLPPRSGGASVVYEAPRAAAAGQARGEGAEGRGADRVEASMFANPATTVPKGAIVQAVLETALDSTRAGPARAIISRDVRSFDGTRILIQRGSRLYGEYKADISAGQNRALIQWQRLMRPDGAVIELDSPSADPLGRAGVRGKVNTHFFERFGGAILQSVLDIGVAVATRSVTDDTVIIGLPGAVVPQVMATPPDQVRPTLKVPQGTAVSVFVARDLDFTRVER